MFNAQNELYVLNRSTFEPDSGEGIFVYDAQLDSFVFFAFPEIEGQKIRLKNVCLASDSVLVAMSYGTAIPETSKGLYSFDFQEVTTRLIKR